MMNKAFDKILERFGELHERYVNQYGVVGGNPMAFSVKECMEIVQEVAEEYKGGWIACNERLPEESGTYIVNAIENHIVHVTFAKWMPRMKRWNLSGNRSYWKITCIRQ